MNLLDTLKLNNYSILATNGYFSKDRGIKPILMKLDENLAYFKDLEVADKVIGKASAMLLTKSGVKKIYAIVLSNNAKQILDKYQIKYEYELLVDKIYNRNKTDICPMEKLVKDIDDLDEAYLVLSNNRLF